MCVATTLQTDHRAHLRALPELRIVIGLGIHFRVAHVLDALVPVVFRTPRALAALNVCAVGFAIAAVTTAAFTVVGADNRVDWSITAGLPTLVAGMAWAALLRSRDKIGTSNIPLGWVVSVPLAALNSAVACGIMISSEGSFRVGAFFGGMLLGATFGAFVWVPALLVVLLLFGMPIARARRLAQHGLTGEDRGERFVGFACAILAMLALASSWLVPERPMLLWTYAVIAALAGGTAIVIAGKREAMRRRFVTRVLNGEVAGLRVEARSTGKVLVRVESTLETYRVVPPPDEELFELDEEGRALHAVDSRAHRAPT